ncbi:U3 small nucleolar ribonucleoprotein mpp10 [Paramyrothecium foliicola]|nr:U3 small nucleolar ribonucleoprotein mpp10 [Paramyrothecium foliicola]
MAPAMPNGVLDASGDVRALLHNLQPGNRHIFLQPSPALPTGFLKLVKETLEAFAGQVSDEQAETLKENRKRKRGGNETDVLKIRKVYVDGFDTTQVWQQAKRIIGGVLDHSTAALDELEEKNEVAMEDQLSDAAPDSDEEEEEELEEDGSEAGSEDEQEIDGADLSDAEGMEDMSDASDKHHDEAINDFGQDDEENDGEDNEGDESEDEFVEDPNGLNDGFFSIDDFNRQTQWFEEQDARGDPNTDHASDDEDINWDADPLAPAAGGSEPSKRGSGAIKANRAGAEEEADDDDDEEDGPTFGDMSLDAPEGDSEDEAMDDMMADDEAMDFNANDVYYKDFFAPPPRKSRGDKPRKTAKGPRTKQPDSADIERAMADVRRDLFEDESEMEDSDDALSDVSAGDPKSRRSAHERRQAKLAEEIRKLEAASVAKREWALSGEAAAAERPVNSLLEEDLDFEHVGKPVPVITPEVSESMEALIKRRILAQEFDEVLRRRPDAEAVPAGTRRGMLELDDSKSGKGLAEIYEEEHVKNANPDTYISASDEKLQREEREVAAMWTDVCGRLDALSNWHYRPKPAAPTISVVSDVAAVAMEDAQPTTAQALAGGAAASRMAPQEVYKPGDASSNANGEAAALTKGEVVPSSGLPVARAEMSREDKARRRRREKERMSKAGGADAAGKNGRPLSGKAKMQRDTMAELKKGGVKVINRKGEITDVAGNKAKAAKPVSSGSYKL